MKYLLKKSARGFTLIELLVVIAIIAILSTIVLASLNGARSKAKNARIRSEISNMRAQAELFYSSGDAFSYEGVCDAASTEYGLLLLIESVEKNAIESTTTCGDDANGWSVSAGLVGDDVGKFFCADSTGYSGLATTTVTTPDYTPCDPVTTTTP